MMCVVNGSYAQTVEHNLGKFKKTPLPLDIENFRDFFRPLDQ